MKRLLSILLAAMLLLPSVAFAEVPADVFTAEEAYSEDREGGHWEYTSDSLAIYIDRHNTTVIRDDNGREAPLVYYVAHIYQRNYSSFRPAFGDVGHVNVNLLQTPAEIVRRDRAVFAITGDNVTQQEADMKGAILREGKIYNDHTGEAVLAIKDDLTIEIFLRSTMKGEDLLEAGIRNTFSFGPWLIMDGEPNPDVARFRVNRVNPRVGLGMIEPGHFVAIVVDGRQENYSFGMTLPQFRDLFVAEGCVEAYNLDGGNSTGMIFMGEHLNYHDGSSGAADKQRKWCDGLMWGYSELVPTVDDPYLHNGNQEG